MPRPIKMEYQHEPIDVSVVIPYYNSPSTLERAIRSVLNQTMLPKEILIIDDGSDLPAYFLICRLNMHSQVALSVHRTANKGAPSARNLGIRLASSTYIALLDADDAWHPQKLQLQYHVMVNRSLPICGHLYSCNSAITLPQDIASEDAAFRFFRCLNPLRLAVGNPVHTPTVMLKKSSFVGFDEEFLVCDDFKAWAEHVFAGKFGFIDLVLARGYKPAIGHSGLTSSIKRIHDAHIRALLILRKQQKIKYWFFLLSFIAENVKYPLRLLRKPII